MSQNPEADYISPQVPPTYAETYESVRGVAKLALEEFARSFPIEIICLIPSQELRRNRITQVDEGIRQVVCAEGQQEVQVYFRARIVALTAHVSSITREPILLVSYTLPGPNKYAIRLDDTSPFTPGAYDRLQAKVLFRPGEELPQDLKELKPTPTSIIVETPSGTKVVKVEYYACGT